jgi:hypothetical protein
MISKIKKVFALLSFLFVSYTSFAQNGGPKEIFEYYDSIVKE